MKMTRTAVLAAVLAAGFALPVTAASAAPAQTCHVHQVGSHWTCVTPGAFCPKAAHNHFGYVKNHPGKRDHCKVASDSRWRWLS